MQTATAVYFAGSLFFALISVPMAISAEWHNDVKKFISSIILAMMSALFLFQGLRNL